MSLRVVGAGLGRTGTASLKQALELLLGGRCYHMFEVWENPGHDVLWRDAVGGEEMDWDAMLGAYTATVDWPACAFWSELASASPEAVVVLSMRDSAEQWWASMERTIVPTLQQPVPADRPDLARHREMVRDLLTRRFTPDWDERDAAMAAYESHNEQVRRAADRARIVEWRPGDGWEPLCTALGVAVPQAEFPHENTRADFRARIGLDDS
jgi:hypothetical protein